MGLGRLAGRLPADALRLRADGADRPRRRQGGPVSDERRDDEGRDEPAGPSEEEEKGLGLTEEFARLEQEIRREVGGEGDDDPSVEEEPADDEPDAGEPAAEEEHVAE